MSESKIWLMRISGVADVLGRMGFFCLLFFGSTQLTSAFPQSRKTSSGTKRHKNNEYYYLVGDKNATYFHR